LRCFPQGDDGCELVTNLHVRKFDRLPLGRGQPRRT
jgi:hypothetical protein